MSKIIEALPAPPLYYHGRDTSYWRRDESDSWIRVNETSAKSFVVEHGYSRAATRSGANNDVDRCLMRVQSNRNVAYIGPLAGFPSGVHPMAGRQALVTESPRFIEPKAGEWPTLQRLFDGMLIDGGLDQRPYFFGWLKSAMDSFRNRRWKASQLLALAGPVGCGKSLTQNLVTEMFGGRSTKPYQYMMGLTTFNAHMFRGEHQMLEDEAESTRIDCRRHFAANIKTILTNRDQNCHGKNQDAVTLQPIWRMSLSLNDDSERLLVLPPFDSDVRDKIIALKVKTAPMPMPTSSAEDEERFWTQLVNELPAFLHYIEHEFVVPENLRDARYGIVAFQHPELAEKIQDTAPEIKLLNLIDAELFRFPDGADAWEGSAENLESRLFGDSSGVGFEAKRLLSGPNAVGRYLGRLKDSEAEQAAGRVSSRKVNGYTRWTIQPPQRAEPAAVTPATPPKTAEAPVQLPPVPESMRAK